MLVRRVSWREHKPELASREKVEQVIASFQRKARAAATASVNSIGPSWRELMYDSITKRSGVDPREHWDLAVASEVASSAAQRQRQRTEAAVATRRLAATEPTARILFYYAVLSLACVAPFSLGDFDGIPAAGWLAIGTTASRGQLFHCLPSTFSQFSAQKDSFWIHLTTHNFPLNAHPPG